MKFKGSTRLILVNFSFLKSTQNFLQDGGHFVFVAICGGSPDILTGLAPGAHAVKKKKKLACCQVTADVLVSLSFHNNLFWS